MEATGSNVCHAGVVMVGDVLSDLLDPDDTVQRIYEHHGQRNEDE